MPDDTKTEFCWLVEEFAPNGNSTGRYMLDMGSLAITHDVYAARRLRREQSAGFRALDMKERYGGDWRSVEHGFEPAPAAQPAMPEPVAWYIVRDFAHRFYTATDPRHEYSQEWLDGCDSITPLYAAPAPAPSAQPLTEAPAELRGLDTSTRVRFYEHDFYVLSNFSAFKLYWRGLHFQTSEAAYHFEKFINAEDGALADVAAIRHAILKAPSAHEAFKIAERNKAHRRPDWDDVKVVVMLDILRAKAQQHEYVRRKLLATGDRELVEDSWRDDFWGWGPNRDGKNMLGCLWMQVRAELRGIGATHA